MRKNKLIGLIIMILLIGVGAYVLLNKSPAEVNCEEIEGAEEIIECYKNLLQKTKDISVCHNLGNGFIEDKCYSNFALIEQNYSICERWVSSDWVETCNVEIVASKGGASFCGELSNRDLVTSCYSTFAIREEDTSICENLEEIKTNKPVYSLLDNGRIYGSEIDYCYYWFGDYKVRMQEKDGVSVCDNIKGEIVKNACYADFAQRFQDDLICENIENTAEKEECIIVANIPPY
jgi:hypothetical protein